MAQIARDRSEAVLENPSWKTSKLCAIERSSLKVQVRPLLVLTQTYRSSIFSLSRFLLKALWNCPRHGVVSSAGSARILSCRYRGTWIESEA